MKRVWHGTNAELNIVVNGAKSSKKRRIHKARGNDESILAGGTFVKKRERGGKKSDRLEQKRITMDEPPNIKSRPS